MDSTHGPAIRIWCCRSSKVKAHPSRYRYRVQARLARTGHRGRTYRPVCSPRCNTTGDSKHRGRLVPGCPTARREIPLPHSFRFSCMD